MTKQQLDQMGAKAREVNFRAKLETSRAWAERGLVVIHEYQTQAERDMRITVDHNGVGFTGFDAPLLSQFAEQLQRGQHLSDYQLRIAQRRMPKYARQLVAVAMGQQ